MLSRRDATISGEYLPLLFRTGALANMLQLGAWRSSQGLRPTFLLVLEGSCLSGCPGQGGLRARLGVPKTCRHTLKCYVLASRDSRVLAAQRCAPLFGSWQRGE